MLHEKWRLPFTRFQYPFILSIVAKRHILTKDSEQQMILTARRSLIQKMARNQAPKIEIFFLNISVRRAHVKSPLMLSIFTVLHSQNLCRLSQIP